MAETATQEFLQVVRTSVEGPKSEAQPAERGAEATTPAAKEGAALHRERLAAILSGEESIKLYLEFLYRNNKSDLLILKNTLVRLSPFTQRVFSKVTAAI